MRWNIPNRLCVARIVMVPVLFWLAWIGAGNAFLIVLMLSFATDLIDGPIARRLNQVTDFGAQLDSWGDFGVYVAIPVGGMWLWPDVMRAQAPYVAVVVLAYSVPIAASIIKFGQLPSIHTYGAKLGAVGFGASVLLMFGFGMLTPFRICSMLSVLAALDELAVILVLRNWRTNVRSVVHAWRMRRAGLDVGRPGDHYSDDNTKR